MPPLAAKPAEYAVLSVPAGNEVVVITSAVGCTVKKVLPDTPETVAETVMVPGAREVARPAELMVATEGVDDTQTAWLVRFAELPSEYVPVATNCWV